MADPEKGFENAGVDAADRSDGTGTPTTNSLSNVASNEALRKIDLDNKQAFKGDLSDGRVEWTVRKLLAATFLCMLFTGQHLTSAQK